MNNKSAFPLLPPVDDTGRTAVGYPYPESGMTLRDYFAAKAMQALIHASADATLTGTSFSDRMLAIPSMSFEAADAMLKASCK